MALANNKRLLIGEKEIEKAGYDNKAAKTNYLPKLKATAAYFRNSRETHLLNNSTRHKLNNLGSSIAQPLASVAQIVEKYHPELTDALNEFGNNVIDEFSDVGKKINEGFETDTRNMFAGALTITQPLYMGGKILAYNEITDYAKQIAEEKHRGGAQEVVLEVDEAYWRVVSLANKKKLAESYVNLLKHLDDDMQKMIKEGVATKANGLTVSVKLNEAEMTLTKVDNGLTLSRMLLCQLCGMPIESNFTLEDEQKEQLAPVKNNAAFDMNQAKSEAAIAIYELEEAKEKIELQVNQQSFRVKEAEKTLARARKNCESADENMKTANAGFKEGVIPTSDLLAAQTDWVSAHSEVIDAEINARLTQVYLKKSLGTLE